MSYVKSFAHGRDWIEISLTESEEEEARKEAENAHLIEMNSCIEQAREIARKVKANGEVIPMVVVSIANCLFDKRASHTQYFREAKARLKFEAMLNGTITKRNDGIVQGIKGNGELV